MTKGSRSGAAQGERKALAEMARLLAVTARLARSAPDTDAAARAELLDALTIAQLNVFRLLDAMYPGEDEALGDDLPDTD